MAITFQQGTSNGAANAGPVTATFDSTPAAGDLILVYYVDSSTSDKAPTLTSSGYTDVSDPSSSEQYANGTSDTNARAWYKYSDGTETNVVGADMTGTADGVSIVAMVFRGVASAAQGGPFSTAPVLGTVNTTNGNFDNAQIATASGDVVVLMVGAAAGTIGTFTAPTNYTTNAELGTAGVDTTDARAAMAYRDSGLSNPEDPAAWAMSGTSHSSTGITLALKAAPAVVSVTHTATAVVLTTPTVSHTVDAVIEAAPAGAAVVRGVPRPAPLPRPSHVAYVRVYSEWSDEVCQTTGASGTQSLTHTVDAVVLKTATRSHTVDAVVLDVTSLTHDVTAVVLKTTTLSHSVDAVVLKTATLSHTATAVILKTAALTHTVDAVILKAATLTHSVDAVILKQAAVSHEVDAFILAATAVSHTVTVVILDAGNTLSHSVDAVVLKTTTAAHTVDAIVLKTTGVSHQVDAQIQAVTVVQHSVDAVIYAYPLQPYSGKFQQPRIVGRPRISVKLPLTNTTSHSVDAVIWTPSLQALRGVKPTYPVSVYRTSRIVRIPFAVLLGQTRTHQVTAVVLAPGNIRSHAVDAVVLKTTSVGHSVDALIYLQSTHSHTTTAVVLVTQSANHTTTAVVHKQLTLTHTTTAVVLQANNVRSHQVDAEVGQPYKTRTHQVTAYIYLPRPTWPQTNDPDSWPQTNDPDSWPQTNDPDSWPQTNDPDIWP